MIVRRVVRWVDDRLATAPFAHTTLNRVFPDHWSFLLGEVALYCFMVLLATGTFLAMFFEPSVSEVVYDGAYEPLRGATMSRAYASVLEISFGVRAGLLIRQMHHWAALLFAATIFLHLARIFFTGAFRRPREINWLVGVTLLVLAVFNGWAGYLLPGDTLHGTGLRIGYAVAMSVPVLGPWLVFLLFGGEYQSPQILSRLFVAHVYIVPLLILGLVSLHMAILWRQKHTQFAGRGRTETNVVGEKMWPTYAAKAGGLFFAVVAITGLLGGLVQINPVWLYLPDTPWAVTSPAQPDWYFGWLDGALRIFPAWEMRAFGFEIPSVFFPGVLLPAVSVLLLYLWPFLEARFGKDLTPHHLLERPRDRPLRSAIGTGLIIFYGVLLAAAGNDLYARALGVQVLQITNLFRVLTIVLPLVGGLITYRILRALREGEIARASQADLGVVAGGADD